MKDNEEGEFLTQMTGVCELYAKKSSPQFLALYWQALKVYELEDVKRALRGHMMNADNGQFMPKPADIVRYLDGGSTTRAAKAWAKVHYAIRCVGGGDTVVLDDPIAHAALEGLGSWPEICATPVDELTFLQGRFEKRYQAMAFNPPTLWPRMLIGRYQVENEAAGRPISKPVPIGDVEKCRATYKGGVDPAESIGIAPLALEVMEQVKRLSMPPSK